MEYCDLCPRQCKSQRENKKSFCHATKNISVAKADLHFGEEPCISGKNGSGAVFFSGCTLGCVYCQNYRVSLNEIGREISEKRLYDIFFELKEKGAHNINLVTPDCYAKEVSDVVRQAKKDGIDIPFVCNCSGYESDKILDYFSDCIDIWLPDFKYSSLECAGNFSHAYDYFDVASNAIARMVELKPNVIFDEDGMMISGVLARHMMLPDNYENSRGVIDVLARYKDKIWISIMNQYTPYVHSDKYECLNKRVDEKDYDKLIDYALDLGIENAFVQESESADEKYIPDFDLGGV